MRDEPALRRQWALLWCLTLRRRGVTVKEMAAEAGVGIKTIRRDLELFRAVGFPLEETSGARGRKEWRLVGSVNGPALNFTFEEAAALYLGRRLLDPLSGTPLGVAAQSAFQKVRAALGPTAVDYLRQFPAIFHHTGVHAHDYAARTALVENIQVAVEDAKALRLLYRSATETAARYREVHPLGLVQHGGALYLVAIDPSAGKNKHYKLDRVEDVELTDTSFQRPPDFDLTEHLRSSFGVYQRDGEPITLKVRFAPAVAHYVLESRWHASQSLTRLPDGAVLAEFQLTSTEEARHWILSFGSNALILEPESLRRDVAAEIQELLTAYNTTDPCACMPESSPRT